MDEAPSRRRWAGPLGVVVAVVAGFALVGGCALVVSRVIDRTVAKVTQPLRSEACRDSEVDLVRHAGTGARERVREALDDGQDADRRDGAGNTALACAGPAGHPDVVELLLDAGADPLPLPGELDPPSTIADAAGHTALAASLRDAGL